MRSLFVLRQSSGPSQKNKEVERDFETLKASLTLIEDSGKSENGPV